MTTYDFQRDICRRQREALLQTFGVLDSGEVDVEPIDLPLARQHCNVDLFGSPPESDYDSWFTAVGIPASREYCEGILGRALAPRTVEIGANSSPTFAAADPPGLGFLLPFGPVQSIVSIKYDDDTIAQAAYDTAYQTAYDAEFLSSGDAAAADAAGIVAGEAAYAAALEQTIDPTVYALSASASGMARINLAYGQTWPTARGTLNSVRIQYVTGYSIPDASPQAYRLPKLALAAMLVTLEHLFAHRGDEAIDIPAAVETLLYKVPGRENLGFA